MTVVGNMNYCFVMAVTKGIPSVCTLYCADCRTHNNNLASIRVSTQFENIIMTCS